MTNRKYLPLIYSAVFALLIWFVDAIADYLFFYEGTFLELLLFNVPAHEIFMRLLLFISLLIFGIFLSASFAARVKVYQDLGEAKEILRQNEEKFRLTFENAVDAILWADPRSGLIINCNKAAEKLFEMPEGEIVGLHQTQLHPPGKKKEYIDAFKEDAEEKSFHREAEIITKLGKIKNIIITANLIHLGNRTILQGTFRDVTERKKAEQALRDSEERYKVIFSQAVDTVVLIEPETGAILEFNDKAHQNLGYTREEFKKIKLADFEVIESQEDVAAHIRKIIKQGSDIFETKHRRKDGEIRDILVKANGVTIQGKHFSQAIWVDITERKKAEGRLRKSEHEKTLVLDNVSEIIAYHDVDHNILWANKAYTDAIGLSLQEIKGKKCYSAWRLAKLCNDCPVTKTIQTGKPENAELTPQNQSHWPADQGSWMVRAAPVKDDAGNVIGAIEVSYEITERKKSEEILKEYRTNLEKMVSKRTEELLKVRKELEDSKRLSEIGTLAATVAHELRNPLGVIRAAAYNIKRKSKEDVLFKSHLNNIEKKISESDQIIKNLLSYSRIRMPKRENISCNKLFSESIEHIKEKYNTWNVEIKHKCNCKEDSFIYADPLQMSELHLNILDNAYQAFSNKHGIIEINGIYDKEANAFTINITDNGEGIAKDDLDKVFEPFFTRKSKGVGLGLTVCKQIVDLHRGTINIQSSKGKGTSVRITLPISEKLTKK